MKFKLLPICLLLTSVTVAQNVNVKLRSQLKFTGQTLSNICGYTDETGKEYALVGTSKGMSIVDISNPDAPVEIKMITGPTSSWREIKVRGDYAYVTTEGGGGLVIVDMRSLPDKAGIVSKSWAGGTAGSLTSIHALHIDGKYLYLYGSKLFNGGALVADLTDPYNPVYVGNYQAAGPGKSAYIHDGYVRNDTLYACHIYEGFTDIVDFKDKKKPKLLGTVTTPGKFSHNSWLTYDSKVMFTTDEVNNSFLTAYDVSDPSNITEIDRLQSNPGSQSVVHNTHIIRVDNNDYAVTSWYKDGFTIVDVGRPANMVQVGNYDTYSGSGGGMSGDWGVFPYFPSGNIVVSNIDEGLFVFTPTYKRACYLEGTVTDSITNLPINKATIQLVSSTYMSTSAITGDYAIGMPSPGGTYSITYSATGYISKTLTGVTLSSGVLNVKNVKLLSKAAGIAPNELDRVSINAYPNPFTNEITIAYEFLDKLLVGSSIQVMDMLGRTIDQLEINQVKGSISLKPEVNAGIYFVRVVNGHASSTPVKIVKTE